MAVDFSLYTACLLMGGTVSLSIWFFCLRCPSTGIYRLLDGGQVLALMVQDARIVNVAAWSSVWLPPVSFPRVNCSCPCLTRTLQDQQAGLAQAPIKLLLLSRAPVCTGFCVCPLKVMCVFPQSHGASAVKPGGLQSQMLWELIFPVPEAWAGEYLTWVSELCTCGRTL